MIYIVIILGLIALLESTILTVPLTLILVILFGSLWEEHAESLAFIVGILLDLFTMRPLGLDSLIFLFVLFIWKVYRKKIYPGRMLYRFILISVSVIVYGWFFYKFINIWNVVIGIIISIVFLTVVNRFFPKIWERGRLSL